MKNPRELFLQMPDTVVITDAYGYVLDFNRSDTIKGLKKGLRLTKLISDVFDKKEGTFEYKKAFYRRITSPVLDNKRTIAYIVLLTDITELELLARQSRDRSRELHALTEAQKDANKKLSEYAIEVKNLSDYAEQPRIARSIHDNSGHAVTEIHTICQICLKLMNNELQEYKSLIEEGIKICKNAEHGNNTSDYSSVNELFDAFQRRSSFPVEINSNEIEPLFIKDKYSIIERVLKEAYHNTIEHSLADKLTVEAFGDDENYTLKIQDNGSFRGTFEAGFGLLAMQEYVTESGGTLRFIAEEGSGFGIVVGWRNSDER